MIENNLEGIIGQSPALLETKETYQENLFTVYDVGWLGVLMISPQLATLDQKEVWIAAFHETLENKLGEANYPFMRRVKDELERTIVHERAHATTDMGSGRFIVAIVGDGEPENVNDIEGVVIAWKSLSKKTGQELKEIMAAPSNVPNGQASELSSEDKLIMNRADWILNLTGPLVNIVVSLIIKRLERRLPPTEKVENALGIVAESFVRTVLEEGLRDS